MFDVMWEPAASDELTNLWLAADSAGRAELTAATAEADRLLLGNPVGESESRPDGTRILFALPLAVRFDVDEALRHVRVVQVWLVPRRRPK